MKHLIAILSVITAFAVFAPSAEAWDSCHNSRVVGYTRCGRPIVSVYQVCGYDRCGNPIGHWVTQSYSCGCSICNPRPVYAPYYYRQSGPSCGGGSHHHHSPSRSVGFHFSFGR